MVIKIALLVKYMKHQNDSGDAEGGKIQVHNNFLCQSKDSVLTSLVLEVRTPHEEINVSPLRNAV